MRSSVVTLGAVIVVGSVCTFASARPGGGEHAQRAQCVNPLPSGRISFALRGNGRKVASVLVTGCGPGSSILAVSRRSGLEKDGVLYALVRPGSCTSFPTGRWYPVGFTGAVTAGSTVEANPPLTLERLQQTRFAVELVGAGAVRPAACGEHAGSLPLPSSPHRGRPPFGSAKPVASGALRVDFGRLGEDPVIATITPVAGGNRSLIVIRGPSSGSTGSHVRLRRGSCDRPRPARTREIVLDTYYPDPEDASSKAIASSTEVDVPISALKRGAWILEIHDGSFTTYSIACANI